MTVLSDAYWAVDPKQRLAMLKLCLEQDERINGRYDYRLEEVI